MMAPGGRRPPLAYIVLAPLAIGALACSTLLPTMATPQPITPSQAETSRPTPPPTTPQVRPTAPPTPRPVLDGELSRGGPWLVFLTDEGLWVVNSDGSGLARLIDRAGAEFDHFINGAEADSGGRLALVEVDSFYAYSAPRLELLTLPDSQARQLTQLVPEGFSVPHEEDPSRDVYNAVSLFNTFGWSPDGSQLAFAGAMDGPSADLYVYDVAEDLIRRLTSGPSQTLGISWSPDGEWIVHGGAMFFPWGMAGPRYGMVDVWAARADGSEVRRLYDASDSLDEWVVGWLDDDTFIVNSVDPERPPLHPPWKLRTFNLASGDVRMLREAPFSSVAMSPELGKLLVGADEDVLMYDPEAPRGLRLIDTTTRLEQVVVEDEVSSVRWSSDLDLFLALTDFGVLAVAPNGDFIDLAVPPGAEGFPAVSPKGTELAWTGSGLWVGFLTSSLDQPPRQVFPEPVSLATWGPEGDYLLFFSEGRFYVGRSPDFDPLLVAEGMSDPNAAGWVRR